MSQPISFRWEPEFIARIDRARTTPLGTIPRSAFIRDAVELAIRQAAAVDALAAGPIDHPARHAMQPGPNVEHIRSSTRVKRDVQPIPKRPR